jgi:hypothetical protein
MRLLRCSSDGNLSLTRYLIGEDTIPPYAILSHTWGADTEEVTFQDLENDTGRDKTGYQKIILFTKQASVRYKGYRRIRGLQEGSGTVTWYTKDCPR